MTASRSTMISIEDRASAERDLCSDVVVDRGCSQAAVAEFHLPLQKLGVPVTMDLRVNQRGEVPGVGPARPIDGHLFAEHLPGDLVALDMPPMGSTSEEKKPYIARYDHRAR